MYQRGLTCSIAFFVILLATTAARGQSLPGSFLQVCNTWTAEAQGTTRDECKALHARRDSAVGAMYTACTTNVSSIQTRSFQAGALEQCIAHMRSCGEIVRRLTDICVLAVRTAASNITPTPVPTGATPAPTVAAGGADEQGLCQEARQQRTKDEAACLATRSESRRACDNLAVTADRPACRDRSAAAFDRCMNQAERSAARTCRLMRRTKRDQDDANNRDWSKLMDPKCAEVLKDLDTNKMRYCDTAEQVCRRGCDPTDLVRCNTMCVQTAIKCKVGYDDYAFDKCDFLKGVGTDPGQMGALAPRECAAIAPSGAGGSMFDDCWTKCPGSSKDVQGWWSCYSCVAKCDAPAPVATVAPAACVCPSPYTCPGNTGVVLRCNVVNGRCEMKPSSCPSTSGLQ
jgi:hypothetical protein